MKRGSLAALSGICALVLTLTTALVFSSVAHSKERNELSFYWLWHQIFGHNTEAMCVSIPKIYAPFDTVSLNKIREWNESIQYVINSQNLSVADGPNGSSVLRQRFVPSGSGSERVIAAFEVEPRDTYELRQSIFFENDFHWGINAQSGKFGYGIAGGSAPTGGSLDLNGFSARLAWYGRGDGTVSAALYVYSADRTQNRPYGDKFEIPDFSIPKGEWFDVAVRVKVNSAVEKNDGSFSVWINDELKLEKTNIQWQSQAGSDGQNPSIDRLLFSSFHGGNSNAWSPSGTVHARFGSACLHD